MMPVFIKRDYGDIFKEVSADMDISVKPLLSGSSSKVSFTFEIPIDYKENDYKLVGPAEISGAVKDMGGYMQLDAECSVNYETRCARCLKKLEGTCSISFMRPVAVKLESESEEDEYLIVDENGAVNIDRAVSEELLLSLPFRSLCSEDCKGLCPVCGCNKNETECSCTVKQTDPRWDILRKLRDN